MDIGLKIWAQLMRKLHQVLNTYVRKQKLAFSRKFNSGANITNSTRGEFHKALSTNFGAWKTNFGAWNTNLGASNTHQICMLFLAPKYNFQLQKQISVFKHQICCLKISIFAS